MFNDKNSTTYNYTYYDVVSMVGISAVTGCVSIALLWSSKKLIPHINDASYNIGAKLGEGGVKLGEGLYNMVATPLSGIAHYTATLFSGATTCTATLFSGATTFISDGYNVISAPFVAISTVISNNYSAISTVISNNYSAISTVIKWGFYGNIALFVSAGIADVTNIFFKEGNEFKFIQAYWTYIGSKSIELLGDSYTFVDTKLIPNLKTFGGKSIELLGESYTFTTRKLIPDLDELVRGAIDLWHYYLNSTSKVNLEIQVNERTFNSILDDYDKNQNSGTRVTNESKETQDINKKQTQQININLSLEDTQKLTLDSLIESGIKLYVTDNEKQQIKNFFTEDKLDEINKDNYECDENKFSKSSDYENFLTTTILYNKLKNVKGKIPDEYVYCTDEKGDEEEKIKCSKKEISKIVVHVKMLAESVEEINKINDEIKNALKESGYTREEVNEAIQHCNGGEYDDKFICSNLFEGAANEYFNEI